jgi:hypothetical protein
MKRGRTAVSRFKATIGNAIATVARFAKGLALVGVGAMTVMIKKSLQTLDVVSKLSRRIGIATEELLALRHAAELAGVSNQALDKSLEIFVRRMGEVKSGSGEAKRGLEALGLSAERMISMTPEKALLVIADRIQELGTQAEKSAAAYFLFGRAGAQLLNLFENGSKGIREATDEARDLDLVLKGFDLTRVEDANDAMTKFKSSINAVFLELTIKLAPSLKKIADFMTLNRDVLISITKRLVTFSAKLLISVGVIKLVIGAIKSLSVMYTILTGKQITLLALSGPTGWAVLLAGVALAVSALAVLDKQWDKLINNLKEPVSVTMTRELPKTIEGLEKRIALLKSALEREQVSTAADPFEVRPLALKDLEKQIRLMQAARDAMPDRIALADELARKEKERLAMLERQQVAFTSLVKFEKDLQRQFDEFGLSNLEAQLLRVKKAGEGLTGDAFIAFNRRLKATQDLIRRIDEKSAILKLSEEAKILSESLKTPVERLADLKDKLSEMFKRGFIDARQFAKALAGAQFGEAGDFQIGKFQEVRSEFIDVAALSGATKDQELRKQNTLTERTNEILSEIRAQGREGFKI